MKQTHGLIPLSTTTIIREREQISLPKEKEIESRVAVLQNYPAADPKINHFSLVELRGNEILLFCNSQSICSSATINLKAYICTPMYLPFCCNNLFALILQQSTVNSEIHKHPT
jgi:hypothetical protein